jgi:hypothetical protein
MKTSPSSAEQRRAWAADRLGLPADATGPAARAAFLRRLPGVDFAPPPAWRAALDVLEDRPARGADAEWPRADQDAGRAEVEAFAGQFWSLPPAVRRRRWQELRDRHTADRLLAARLRRLEAGLDLPGDDLTGDDRLDELTGWLRAQFVLRPSEQATQRVVFLRGLVPTMGAWEDAARRLQRGRPEVADLAPEFVASLATANDRRRRLAVSYKRLARGTVAILKHPIGGTSPRPARSQRAPAWLIIFAIMFMARIATTAFNNATPRNSWEPPTYRPPAPVQRPWEPAKERLRPLADPWGDTKPNDFEAFRRMLEKTRDEHGFSRKPTNPVGPDTQPAPEGPATQPRAGPQRPGDR